MYRNEVVGYICVITDPAHIEVWAVERHFAESRLLHFVIAAGRDLEPEVAADLAPLASGHNFESVAALADGRVALVNDNFYRAVTGPSEVVFVTPGRDYLPAP